MALQPGPDLGVLMRGVIVEDDMDDFPGRDVALDEVQEPDELLIAMAGHVPTRHFAGQHIECGEERRGPVALVVVRQGRPAPLFQRQARLGTVERLYLGFLIDRQHDGVGGGAT